MQNAVATTFRAGKTAPGFLIGLRSAFPSPTDLLLAIVSAILLILSFPDFDLWPMGFVGLVPILWVISRRPRAWPSFFATWLAGTIFFFTTCYWLTYSMIHYGGIPTPLAYVMLIPGALVMGLFPAGFAVVIARSVSKFGLKSLLLAPLVWPAFEWLRLQVTGQLWNALGYSLAFEPVLIQSARFGGVYAVSFLILTVNVAITLLLVARRQRPFIIAAVVTLALFALLVVSSRPRGTVLRPTKPDVSVVAIQPNVPMDLVKPVELMRSLTDEHFATSEAALRTLPADKPRLVIWPESPMNFTYGTDALFRDRLTAFVRANHTSLILNSQEPAPNDGIYNSALLINEQGGLVAQYDKIRLLPFGEYDPLPTWSPGAGLITAIVGDFTPGTNYRQLEVGAVRTGVFICIESAYPHIARRYVHDGADALINISNDGYLGPTAVMRQHLANAVFRAVENGRPLLRVTNTGITAFITDQGNVLDATQPFQRDVRIWGLSRNSNPQTFYSKRGDVFVIGCALITLMALILTFTKRRQEIGE